MNKKLILMIICLVLCLFISLSAVSATEEIENQTLTNDDQSEVLQSEDDQSSILQSNDDEDVLNSNNGEGVLSASPGNFTALHNLIKDMTPYSQVFLDRDYIYDPDTDSQYRMGINLTNNYIIINGNNHKIDGNGMARIFAIGTDGKNHVPTQGVILMNINFENAYNLDVNDTNYHDNSGRGTAKNYAYGAVEFYGSGEIINCTFKNNYAWSASAIALADSNNMNITNCRFISNTGFGQGGGAIRLKTNVVGLTIKDCWFEDNYGKTYGGAVHSDKGVGNDAMTVTNCDFINNRADNGAGALFFESPDGTLENSRFFNNSAYQGGALYWNGVNGEVGTSNFTKNNATQGGAIYCSNSATAYISTSNFSNNTASYGGAVYFNNNSVSSISSCSFYNNSAIYEGGAIYCTGKLLRVLDSDFEKDHAEFGGGLYLDVGAYVYECEFIQENASTDGGAIYLKVESAVEIPAGVDLGVFSTNFTRCHADHDGGAGYVYSDYGIVKDTIFTDCTAGNDGAAGYIFGSFGKLINSQLIANIATHNGGAVYWAGNNGTIENTSFKRNRALSDGAALYWAGNNGEVLNTNFTLNTAVGVTGEGNGGSLVWKGSNGVIDNCYANISNAKSKGGVAYIAGNDVNITKSKFNYYNVTQGSGGALYIEGNNTNITKSSFEYGEASQSGGAIFISGDKTYIYNSNLTHNHANGDGGIVYIEGDNTKIIKSNITHSYSYMSGGSIYINGSHTLIKSVNFTYNNASTLNGGSIYISGNDTNITNSIFHNCFAQKGGAIYVEGSDARIFESTFAQNGPNPESQTEADTLGGSIFIAGHRTIVDKSNFTRTSAKSGGAIYITGDGANITNSRFNFTAVDDEGGSVYVGGVNTHIISSTFDFTNATHGGAIYVNGNDIYIESNFTHNFANGELNNPSSGGAIYVTGSNNKIYNSNFTLSMAIGGNGGAIYAGGVNTTIFNLYSNITQAIRNGPGNIGNGGAIYIMGNGSKVLNSTFERYNATDNGGGLFVQGNGVNISYSSFEFGEASRGGGIYINGNNTYMEFSNLTHNHAIVNGGVIYIMGNDAKITDSRMEYSYAGQSGGAVFISGQNNLITKSNLTYNNATSRYGGSIFIDGDNNNITYSQFENCTSTRGGAIYINGNDAHVLYSNFSQNGINPKLNVTTGTAGGTIYIAGNNTVVSYDDFRKSMAYDGGLIYVGGNGADINHSNFTMSTAYHNGGAIYIAGNMTSISHNDFSLHNASSEGGAIYVSGDNINISNSKFAITSVNGSSTAGGAVYIGGDDANIEKSNFNISRAFNGNGGAISVAGNRSTIIDSNFTVSLAIQGEGGVMYITGHNATVSNCISNVSQAIGSQRGPVEYAGKGGGIYISGENATIEGSDFKRYNATFKGGAVYIEGSNTNITKSSFEYGESRLGGGIYIEGNGTCLSHSNLTHNHATVNGGVIYINGHFANITNSRLEYSYAEQSGGAIFINGTYNEIRKSNLTHNNATNGFGGSVYINGSNNNITDSFFAQCTSTTGGAIYVKGTEAHIIRSNFTQNGVNPNLGISEGTFGGTIYVEGANAVMSDDKFNQSIAYDGGCIYIKGNDANILNSDFTMTSAHNRGGAVYVAGVNALVNNSDFSMHNATNGGCIYVEGADANITYSNFTTVSTQNGNGGAIYVGGNNADIINSRFNSTRALNGNGGAIYVEGNFTDVSHSTFDMGGAFNQGSTGAGYGGMIYISGQKTVIDNSTFTRYNGTVSGGALYIKGANSNITNSSFEYGESRLGGAIYIEGANTRLVSSNLTHNHATGNGGCIYVYGRNTTIDNSNINLTYCGGSGGAVYINGEYAKIINSNLTYNNAVNGPGGSVYVNGNNANITGSLFQYCSSLNGGAIYVKGVNATIDGSTFTQNNVSTNTSNGGAIYVEGSKTTISGSNFTRANANRGGFVYIKGNNVNITHSTFAMSYSYTLGGAIYIEGTNASILSSSFSKHNATEGGAVFVQGANANITDSDFELGHASSSAGGIFIGGVNTYVFNSTFDHNTANDGGAMFNNGGSATILYSNFTNNIAVKSNGGAIHWKGGTSNDAIIGCYFINNTAKVHKSSLGGAIYWDDGGKVTSSALIKDSVFINNTAGRHGGAINWFRANDGLIENCNFTDNYAYSNGGAIYAGHDTSDGRNLTIRNCNFTLNYAVVAGGALCLQFAESHAVDCIFDSNSATDGGSIYCANSKALNSEYVNCKFINSTTHEYKNGNVNGNGGAAFIATKYTNFTNCEFINCRVYPGNNGGAIYFQIGSDYSNVDGCNFTNCTASRPAGEGDGGAIYIYGNDNNIVKNITVHNSTFTNTSARDGGAIYIIGTDITIDNSTFNSIFATRNGGAIYIKALDNELAVNNTISNSTFKNNHAVKGGAIYLNAYGNNIANSSISDNLATNGAGIYLASTDNNIIVNTNITGNNATRGSGIYAENSNYTLNGVRLLDNQAHAAEFINKAINMDSDGRYYVTATFTGNDNLLNAIWNDENSNAAEFNNVVYWDANGVNTTSTVPELNTHEAGINITVTRIKTRSPGEVVVTDEDGAFKYYFEDDGDAEFKFSFTHYEDKYYTGLTDETSILATNVTIEIEDIDFGENATVNVTLKDRDGNNLTANVTVKINTTVGTITIRVVNGVGSLNNVSGLSVGLHNATVTFEGNETHLGAVNSTTFWVRTPVNVTITKQANLTNTSVGGFVKYSIIIYNSGQSTASNVIITDSLEKGLKYIQSGSNSTNQGSMEIIDGVEVVTWGIGNLGPGDKVLAWVIVNTTTNGTFGNVAVVSSTEGGTNSSNTTNVTVNPLVRLNITKTVNSSTVNVGELAKFTINVTNYGPSNATMVNVTDVLNIAFKFNSTNISEEHYSVNGQKIIWTIPKIANGTSYIIELVVRVMTNGTFSNVATVNCSENKTNIDSNETNVTINPVVNLTIVKVANVTNVSVGELVKFTINVTNHGPSNATGINITDILDSRFGFVSTNATKGSYEKSENTIIWHISKLENSTSYIVELVVRVLGNGTIENVVSVNSTENTTKTDNKTSVNATYLNNFTITKQANASDVHVGELVKFTITVTNHGPSNATGVNITDILDSRFGYVSDNSTGRYDAGTRAVIWSIGAMENNTSKVIELIVRVLGNGTIENVVSVNSTENTTGTENKTSVNSTYLAKLTITKQANVTNVSVGELVKFTITVANNGPSNATNVNVTDRLDSKFAHYSGGIYNPLTHTVTWNIGFMENNTSQVFELVVRVLSEGIINNTVSINSTENTTGTENKTNVNATNFVNLTVVKVPNVNVTSVGGLINFTITVTNNGPTNATNVKITDDLISGWSFVDAGGNFTRITGQKVVWTISKLPSGNSTSVWLQVRTLTNGTLGNIVSVNSTENTTDVYSNETNVTVSPVVNLTVVKTANVSDVHVGELVKFTINVTNHGPSNATGVNITDILDSRFIFISTNATEESYTQSGRTIIWHIDKLENNTSYAFELVVRVIGIGIIENVVSVNSTENTTGSGNKTTVNATYLNNFTVIKQANVSDVHVGELVKFTITVTNHGPSNATNVNITDILDDRFIFVSTNATVESYNKSGQTIVWHIDKLENNTSYSVELTVRVLGNGTIENVVSVNSTENKTGTDNKTSVNSTYLANLTVIKEANVSDVHVGELVKFTITVTNHGPSNATYVNITDILNDKFAYVSTNATVGSYTKFGKTIIWHIDKLENNTSYCVELVVRVLGEGIINNTVSVNSTENTTGTENKTTVNATYLNNFTVIKVANVSDVHVGELVKFTITVTNYGPSNATNVNITDRLSPKFDYVSNNSTGSYDANTRTVIWNIGFMENNTSRVIELVVRVLGNGTIENFVSVNSTENKTGVENKTSVNATYLANLTVVKKVNVTSVNVGELVKFTINVTNYGPSNAINVNVTDVLDTRFEFISTNASYTRSGQTVIWNISKLTNNTSYIIEFTVRVLGNGTIENVVSVNSTENKTGSENKTSVNSTYLANLTVIKQANVTNVSVGELVKFTITVTNYGPSNATDVNISDILDSRFGFVSTNATADSYIKSGQTIVWHIDKLENNTSFSVELIVRVLGNGTIENIVSVNSTENKTGADNKTTVNATYLANLTVIKKANVTSVNGGELIKFTITVTNYGPSNATNVNVTDVLDSRFEFISTNTSSYTKFGQTIIWNISKLTNNTSRVIELTVRVLGNGTIENIVSVNSTENKTGTENKTTVDAAYLNNFTIIKVANVSDVHVGELVKFTITVTNYGPSNATWVNVTDKLDYRFGYVSDNSTGSYDVDAHTVIWNIGFMQNNTSRVIELVVRVLGNGTIENIISVNSTENKTGIENKTSVNSTYLTNLTVVKEANVTNINVGELVKFTINVTNYGPSNATNVNIADILDSRFGFISTNASDESYTKSGQTIVWHIDKLENNTFYCVELVVRVLGEGIINNTVRVNSTENTTGTENKTSVNATNFVNLTVVKVPNINMTSVGGLINFTITVTNNGPTNATNVKITDDLIREWEFVDAGGNFTRTGTQKVVWTISELTSGNSTSVWLQVRALINGTLENVVYVNSTENTTNVYSNETNVTVSPVVNLTVVKTANVTSVSVGELVKFTINVTNYGPSNATNVNITDILDSRFEFVSTNATDGSYTRLSQTIVWHISKLINNASYIVELVVRVLGNGTIENVVSVNSTENTTGTVNKTSVNATYLNNFTVIKVANVSDVHVGELVKFTITVTNYGPSNATNVNVTDMLNSKFYYVSDNSTGSYDSLTHAVIWNIGFMENNTSRGIELVVRVLGNGTIDNIVSVNSTENKTGVENKTSVNSTYFNNFTVIKEANVSEVHVGELVKFTINVTNHGPSNATDVNITDILDSRFEFVSTNVTEESYTKSGQTIIWYISKLANNTSYCVELIVKVIGNGTIENVVSLNSTENTTGTSNKTTVNATNLVNLTVIKTANINETSVGGLINFTITVTNNGPTNATNVKITDELINGFAFVDAGGNFTRITAQKVVWTISELTSGNSTSVWVQVHALTNGTLVNVAIVNSTENITDVYSNQTNVTVDPYVNLTIVKSANVVGNVSVDDLVNFTITVTNNGLSNATNVVISDILDEAFKWIGATDNKRPDVNHKITWTIDKIENGTSAIVWVQVEVLTNGTLYNTAHVNCSENTTDVQSIANVTVDPKVNLTIIKTSNAKLGDNVSVGDLVNFTITVTNNGPSNATNVLITDVLSDTFEFNKTNGNYERFGQKIIWKINKLTPGETFTINLAVYAINNGYYSNVAVVNSTESENRTYETIVVIEPAVNLTVIKKANVTDNASAGDLVNFTITVTNNGPSRANNVNVTDMIPSGMKYVSSSDGGINSTSRDGIEEVKWNIANMAKGQTINVWVVVRVLANGTLTNVVTANCDENETVTTNSTDLNVTPTVDLTIIKTVDKTSVDIGDTVTYTITVKNIGLCNATGVNVTENLKGSVEMTVKSISKGNFTNYLWNIGNLGANETATLTLNIKVLKAETIENSVIVESNENDTNLTNNNYTSDNVTVNKLQTPIELETINITYEDDETITVTLPTDATGYVNITVNGTRYSDLPIDKGVVTLPIINPAGGLYNVSVDYGGDDNYDGNSTEGAFKVSPKTPIIRIDVVDIYYGEIELLNVTVNAPGFVNITVDNVGMITASLDHSVTTKYLLAASFVSYDGKATWKLINLPVGDYPVFAVYLGNENYTSVSASDVFKVMPLNTTVTVKADDIYVGEDAIINVTLGPVLNATVTVEIDGVKYSVKISDGKGQLIVSGLKAGLKSVSVKYDGNDTYLPSENTTTFTVKKLKPPINVASNDIYVGDDETITVTLPNDATGTVTITVDGKKYTAEVKDGKAVFTVPGLKAGTCSVDATYSGDDKYLPNYGSDTFNVLKHKPDISVDSPDITVGDDGVITVTLPDDATGTVTIEINGKKYTAKVHNGKAVFRIPGLKVGSYPIKAWYSGDDKYLPTNTNGEINVNPVKSNGSIHHEGLKRHATGNPIFVLILVFVSIAIIPFRKFRK